MELQPRQAYLVKHYRVWRYTNTLSSARGGAYFAEEYWGFVRHDKNTIDFSEDVFDRRPMAGNRHFDRHFRQYKEFNDAYLQSSSDSRVDRVFLGS